MMTSRAKAVIRMLFAAPAGLASGQFALPYQRRVVGAIKKKYPNTPVIIYMAPGKYSSGGKRLAQLAASGADIVSVDHTIDIAKAREILPDGIRIQGNLDPKVLRDGPVSRIRTQTEQILSHSPGTTIMNLGHGIEKDTPESHAAFFVKTVKDYRRKTNKYNELSHLAGL